MPKFIYTIIFIIILNLMGINFVLTNTSPESTFNKVIFSILIVFLLSFLLPFIQTMYFFFLKSKDDLNSIFKIAFKKSLLLAFFIGFILYLKTVFYFNYYYFFSLILGFILISKLAPGLRKSRKKSKY